MKTPRRFSQVMAVTLVAALVTSISVSESRAATGTPPTSTNSPPTARLRHGHIKLANLAHDLAVTAPTNTLAPARPPDEIGPHHRTWLIPTGTNSVPPRASRAVANVSAPGQNARIVELASGMNYFDGSQWRPSNPTLVQDGTGAFVADQVQHRVRLESDLNAPGGALSLTLPDGVVLHSTPVAIGLLDARSGRAAIIASVTNSLGILISSNEVAYRNIFAGSSICADVLFHLEKGSFSQNVVFSGKFDVTAYGFPSNSTRIQIISDLGSSPIPQRTRHPIRVQNNPAIRQQWASPDLLDDSLGFGKGVIGPGYAFHGANRLASTNHPAAVAKEVRLIDEHLVLFETIDWWDIRPLIQSLPDCGTGGLHAGQNLFEKATAGYAKIPSPPKSNAKELARSSRGSELASAKPAKPAGVTVDWVVTLSGDGPSVLQSGITYFISQPVYCGPLEIQGGTVVKYPNCTYGYGIDGSYIQVFGDVTVKSGNYSPGIFTAGDDDSVGLTVGWSTDPYHGGDVTPWDGYTGDTTGKLYAAPALWLSGSTPSNLANLRFCYAEHAIIVDGQGSGNPATTVAHSQFVNCLRGIALTGSSTPIYINNCLFANVEAPAQELGGDDIFQFCQCTMDNATYVLDTSYSYGTGTALCTNCILANVVYADNTDGDYNGFYPSYQFFGNHIFLTDTLPFNSEGSGHHYLADESGFQAHGTPAVNPALLQSFKTRSTHSPISAPPNLDMEGELTVFPQVQRYTTGPPDLGFYYPILDITFGNVIVGGTITALPGAAIGVRDEGYVGHGYPYPWLFFMGFDLPENCSFISHGTPDKPVTITGVEAVQEGPHASFAWHSKSLIMFNADLQQDLGGPAVAPPNLDLRFCSLRAAQTDYHLYAGHGDRFLIETGPFDNCSFNACLDWTLRDCSVQGGFINMGEVIPFHDEQSNTDYAPNVAGSIDWANNSFQGVDINFNPSHDPPWIGFHIDLGFKGYNNLFRNSRLRIVPTTGNICVLRDNLFEKMTFYQDTTYALDHDHNAYWPCLSDELIQIFDATSISPSATLEASAGGTSDPSSDKTFAIAPEYQSGWFGDFYVSPASQTFATLYSHGSRSASAAALYHYTDRTDQEKEANHAALNIGLHYVATTNSNSAVPSDYDCDGIADYVEDANGNGIWDEGFETKWQQNFTTSGVEDKNNLLYDDKDLDGDGMVGRIERALTRDPLVADNPLTLNQVSSGDEPDIIAFTTLVPFSSAQSIVRLSLDVDGNQSEMYRVDSHNPDGMSLLNWNTTFDQAGPNILAARLQLRSTPASDTVRGSIFSAQGPINPSPVQNILRFDPFHSEYYDDACLYSELTPPASPTSPAAYTISLYDAAAPPGTPPLKVITGSAENGAIEEHWDGKDNFGNTFTGDSVNAVFQVTPTGGSSQTHTFALQHFITLDLVPLGQFTVAYTCDFDPNGDTGKAYRNMLQFGAVDTLLNPPPPVDHNTRYFSSFNSASSGGLGGNAGYLANQTAADSLLNENLKKGPTRNFFFYGHGCPEWIGSDNWSPIHLERETISQALGNVTDQTTRKFRRGCPYRLVFLNACDTSNDKEWSHAFGIYSSISFEQLIKEPNVRKAQAFAGWHGEPWTIEASVSSCANGQKIFGVIWLYWMKGFDLFTCLTEAQKQNPFGDPAFQLYPPLGGMYGTEAYNGSFYIVYHGYKYLTRLSYNQPPQ